MKTIREQVKEFHHALDIPIADSPGVPSMERVRLRARLVTEEFFEMLDALFGKSNGDLHNAKKILNKMIESADLYIDFVEYVDALGDLDYVVEGSRLEFGVNGEEIAAEIHRSNMSKVIGATKRADGKIIKPSTYSPADIKKVLRNQGLKLPE